MKLGGLFSGIGGFELAWQRRGGTVAWMCEIDRNARKVLAERFPSVPIYEDVEQLDPDVVEPVDVLTGGSPCQGFSIAGSRAGLEHGESRLFADYVRIMDGLAERGLKWALWENVPGVLSIEDDDGNRTFEHVVAALAGGTVPVRLDRDKRWNTGLAAGRRRAVAWRVLDSRFFGVAQRRRRVFACVAFGGACEDRAGRALLAIAEGVPRHSAEGVAAGQGAAGSIEGRVGVPSVTGAVTSKWAKGTGGPSGDEAQNLVTDAPAYGMFGPSGQEGAMVETQPALTASHGQPGNDGVPAMLMTMREGKPGGGKGPLLATEESLTLATGNGQTLFQPQAFNWMQGDGETSLQHHAQTVLADSRPGVLVDYGVRRLTPVECERLQAFPDGWTEPAGSDSARYKALGNAVTVNVPYWLFGRIMEVEGWQR